MLPRSACLDKEAKPLGVTHHASDTLAGRPLPRMLRPSHGCYSCSLDINASWPWRRARGTTVNDPQLGNMGTNEDVRHWAGTAKVTSTHESGASTMARGHSSVMRRTTRNPLRISDDRGHHDASHTTMALIRPFDDIAVC